MPLDHTFHHNKRNSIGHDLGIGNDIPELGMAGAVIAFFNHLSTVPAAGETEKTGLSAS